MKRDFVGMGITGYESFEVWRAYSIGNLAAFFIGSGLAISAATIAAAVTAPLERPVLQRRVPRLALATAACLLLLSVSTLFSLETERVWLSIVPAMLCITAGMRGWMIWTLALFLSAAQTVLTECFLNTHW